MRAAKNTIYASDVTTLPIKVKYTASYYNDTIADNGITISKGVNNPVYSYEKVEEDTLVYRFARQMYYSNFLTGSFPVSSSQYDNFMQSTAASGTLEADHRYFPTGNLDEITVIAIPKTSFGEKISPTTFRLSNSGSFNLYDDGNGNVRDYGTGSLSRYIDYLYHNAPDEYYNALLTFDGTTLVGNIFYSHGIVVITNQDYQSIFDLSLYLSTEDDIQITTEDDVDIITDQLFDPTPYLSTEDDLRITTENDNYLIP